MKPSKLISTPEKWIKLHMALDKENKSVNPSSKEACQWCLYGALFMCSVMNKNFKITADIKLVANAIRNRYVERIPNDELDTDISVVQFFNDSHATTHEEVLNVLREVRL